MKEKIHKVENFAFETSIILIRIPYFKNLFSLKTASTELFIKPITSKISGILMCILANASPFLLRKFISKLRRIFTQTCLKLHNPDTVWQV